ncbi:MAG TPA: M1 family aminopeptidase [Candidatus Binatia bacterium]|nr:M1 family aminopeptidase [Candidatus Binatia bacterium]
MRCWAIPPVGRFAAGFLLLYSLKALAQAGPAPVSPQPSPQAAASLTSGPVLPLYRALAGVGLDPQRIFKVREAEIEREDVHLWLTDGTIGFTQAVDGRVTGAYFEGEGEVLVRPPDRMERASLGLFINAGVLEEKFSSAYLRFNDNTAKELEPFLRPPEEAADFLARNDSKARKLAQMDAMRLCISFTSTGVTPPVPDRLLHARVAGEHYGVFDVFFDTRSPEQIVVGNTSSHEDVTYYDLWMSFPMRSLRKTPLSDTRFGGPSGPLWTPEVLSIGKYTIDATLDRSRNLSADAVLDVNVKDGGARIVLFELSRYLQVRTVEYEGKPLEFIQNEALEGSELSRRGNDTIAVVFPAPLQPGTHFLLRFAYAGSVLADAGGGLLYVGARGTWYPNRGIAMANYDVTFHFPQPWSLIATGRRVWLESQGDGFVGHWVSEQPIPIAGFNVGDYVRSSVRSGNIEVDAYAARGSEFQRSAPNAATGPSPLLSPHAPGTVDPVPMPPPLQNPAGTGESLAERAAQTLTALSQMLGPYAFSSLSLTENPSAESQGWPGLVFLSSYAYLQPEQLRAMNLSQADAVIYSEVMMPHELAHQWYGDKVSWASYHEQWLLEGLANYCSLLLLERTRPADVQLTLENYRQILASRSREGRLMVEAGPVTLGSRLSSSHFPDGYEIITYGRGTWLIHMLRWMLRDASRTPANPEGDDTIFLGLLRNLVERYQQKEITNTDFEEAVEEVLPRSLWFENRKSLDWFFDGWVNGTAFPQLEVSGVKFVRSARGATATGVIRQNSAPFDLVTSVPVYGIAGERQLYIGRVFAEGAETRFALPVPAEVKQMVLDPYHTVLTEP